MLCGKIENDWRWSNKEGKVAHTKSSIADESKFLYKKLLRIIYSSKRQRFAEETISDMENRRYLPQCVTDNGIKGTVLYYIGM